MGKQKMFLNKERIKKLKKQNSPFFPLLLGLFGMLFGNLIQIENLIMDEYLGQV